MFPQVNVRDAEVAMELWTSTLAEEMRVPARLELLVLDSAEAIESAWRRAEVDIMAMTTTHYLDMRQRLDMVPRMVATHHDLTTEVFLLLVPAQQDIPAIADLRGRRILVSALDRGQAAACWLDVLFLRAGLALPAQEGVSLQVRDRASKAVLPLLFGQAEAALVSEASYRLLCELNPQLVRDLRVMARSPALLTRVMCARPDMDPELLDLMIDTALQVHATPKGRQILQLLQSESPARFRPEYLDSLLQLRREREQLLHNRAG
jgi:ABC-type phosphate/phosphonate transport system substrate-binding protein